jgi:hypothetical protein
MTDIPPSTDREYREELDLGMTDLERGVEISSVDGLRKALHGLSRQ